MNLIRSNQLLILLQCFIFSGISASSEKTHRSLVITLEENQFELAKPIEYEESTMRSEFKASGKGKIIHFCPKADLGTNSDDYSKTILTLTPIEVIESNVSVDDLKRCDHPNEPVLFQVKNPKQLKNNWNDNGDIELYHYAYMICVDDFIQQTENVKVEHQYETKCKNNNPILGIEIYFNKSFKQTVAVGYKLLSVPFYKAWRSYEFLHFKSISPLENSVFVQYLERDNDVEFLRKKLGDKAADYYTEDRLGNMLTSVPLAPSHHFFLPLWTKLSFVKANLFPIWYATYMSWVKVEIFLADVASSIGDLTITSGISGIMSLPIPQSVDDESATNISQKQSEPILLQDESNNFRFPNYWWKAVEFKGYGILIVMNCNHFIPALENLCEVDLCKVNGWDVSNPDYSEGKVYCCNMIAENIKKLEADFLSLTVKKPFVLVANSEKKFVIVEST